VETRLVEKGKAGKVGSGQLANLQNLSNQRWSYGKETWKLEIQKKKYGLQKQKETWQS
jgi:hypothetical protein